MDQRLAVVERHAVEVQQAFRIDVDLDALEFVNLVFRPLLGLDAEQVAEAGASAALYAQAQAALRHAVLDEGLADLLNGLGSDVDHASVLSPMTASSNAGRR